MARIYGCASVLLTGVMLSAVMQPEAARPNQPVPAGSLLRVRQNDGSGGAVAVVVDDVPLVHTTQFFPVGDAGEVIAPRDARVQVAAVLDKLVAALKAAGATPDELIRLHWCIVDDAVATHVQREMARRFHDNPPATTWVVSALPTADVLVAVDAVARTSTDPARSVRSLPRSGRQTPATIMPNGTRIYVAGQAENDASLAVATRKTLDSLRRTLQFLGRSEADIAHIRAFLTPMRDVGEVVRTLAEWFGERPVPPVAFVEWNSTLPIEIELIAWGGRDVAGESIEYVTPPGMTTSPVYSRVARINHARSIYLSSRFARSGRDAADEVTDLFTALDRDLQQLGSDLRHLVKATYFVSTEQTSQKLNELRPRYYDPARPPSASKAMVAGVGQSGCALTLDMIAVPAYSQEKPEYGPPEFGHGLDAAQAAAGWISLFDGRSTFGWSGATVTDGVLVDGMTTTAFGPCEVRGEFRQGGSVSFAGRERQVTAGTFEWASTESSGPIRLGAGVAVRRLAVRPIGLASLFNGCDLTGWIPIDHPQIPVARRPKWRVENGALRATGGPGCVEYQPAQFDDFVMQIDVRTLLRHSNGGVFIRAIRGDFMNGYEMQVYNRSESGDPSRPARWSTGAIDDRQNARRMVSRDHHDFKLTVIAHGPHIATWVNGFQQTDWVDDRPPHPNPRLGRRTVRGVVQLQAHDPETDLQFRNINVAAIE